MKKYITILTVVAVAVCSCGEKTDKDQEELGTKDDLALVMKENAFDLFRVIESEVPENENILFSPLSAQSALYMLVNATEENSLEQLRTGLSLEQFYSVGLNRAYRDLSVDLFGNEGSSTCSSQNAVFYDRNRISLKDDFSSDIEDFYEGEVDDLDFADDSAVDIVNDWASEKTNGRIPKVIESLSSDDVLLMLNAFYFKGDWRNGFSEGTTHPREFITSSGQTVEVPTMSADARRSYLENESAQVVDLGFAESKYAMSFLLPKEGIAAEELLSEFDKQTYETFLSDLATADTTRIYLNLPKFSITSSVNLKPPLQALGVEDVFNKSTADLSRLAEGPYFVSLLKQDAFLKIDEKGAEGAAVTVIGVAVTSAPPSVNFNKPFAFVLRHVETGVPIFMGVVRDPR